MAHVGMHFPPGVSPLTTISLLLGNTAVRQWDCGLPMEFTKLHLSAVAGQPAVAEDVGFLLHWL